VNVLTGSLSSRWSRVSLYCRLSAPYTMYSHECNCKAFKMP